jgi:hypothetical protein
MYAASDLKIGTVIDIHDPYSFDEKHKYSIIVGISEDGFYIATVFINSEINISAINSAKLVALQYEIRKAHYSFLKRDSFVDCSHLEDRLQVTLLDQLNSGGRILGKIRVTDLNKVIGLVLEAPSIPPHYIKICNIKPV